MRMQHMHRLKRQMSECRVAGIRVVFDWLSPRSPLHRPDSGRRLVFVREVNSRDLAISQHSVRASPSWESESIACGEPVGADAHAAGVAVLTCAVIFVFPACSGPSIAILYAPPSSRFSALRLPPPFCRRLLTCCCSRRTSGRAGAAPDIGRRGEE